VHSRPRLLDASVNGLRTVTAPKTAPSCRSSVSSSAQSCNCGRGDDHGIHQFSLEPLDLAGPVQQRRIFRRLRAATRAGLANVFPRLVGRNRRPELGGSR